MTARIEDSDKVQGFAAGGDDYILKPFSMEELGARVAAHIRRDHRCKADANVRFWGRMVIDYTAKTVAVEGPVIPFAKKEYEIIELLSPVPVVCLTRSGSMRSSGAMTPRGTAAWWRSMCAGFAPNSRNTEKNIIWRRYGGWDIDGKSEKATWQEASPPAAEIAAAGPVLLYSCLRCSGLYGDHGNRAWHE